MFFPLKKEDQWRALASLPLGVPNQLRTSRRLCCSSADQWWSWCLQPYRNSCTLAEPQASVSSQPHPCCSCEVKVLAEFNLDWAHARLIVDDAALLFQRSSFTDRYSKLYALGSELLLPLEIPNDSWRSYFSEFQECHHFSVIAHGWD